MTPPAELARHAPPLTLAANDDGHERITMPPATGNGVVDLRAAVDALESRLIRRALAQTNNNKQRAAEMLGIKRTTLIDMMKRKGLAA